MRVLLVVLVICAVGGRAGAQPWATGVGDDRKTAAQQLLEAGNQQFIAHDYKAALATYEQAIAQWDHPAIRFNVVRCLIQLDRWVDASDQLELALKYGAAPLEEAIYTEALAYQKLLAGRVGEVTISCAQPGVAVTLDGKPLGSCPLDVQRKLDAGPHQVVGRLAGFSTRTRDLVLVGGRRETIPITLERTSNTIVVHRWPTWIPWLVFGGGFAITAFGGVLDLKASSDMNTYDQAIAAGCVGTACPPGSDVVDDDLRKKAELESRLAVGVMTIGVATIVSGVAMLYLNRGKAVSRERPIGAVRVTPTRDGAMVGVAGRF